MGGGGGVPPGDLQVSKSFSASSSLFLSFIPAHLLCEIRESSEGGGRAGYVCCRQGIFWPVGHQSILRHGDESRPLDLRTTESWTGGRRVHPALDLCTRRFL